MAIEAREANPPLIDRLLKESHNFSFFQAVYLLERYCSSLRNIAHVGCQGPVESEAIRFKADVSLAFPVSDIVSLLEKDSHNGLALFQITTSFLGLYGSTSPLPDFYTEDIIQGDPEESYARDFLDIFHHRLLSLFYRCWLKYRYYIQYKLEGGDEFSQRVFSLIGMGTEGLKEKLHIPPVRLLRYAGLIVQQSRSAVALESLLSDYFGGLSIRIEQCVGRWLIIDEGDRVTLGKDNNRLGESVTIGGRIFDRAGKFRISINLAEFADFVKFLPDGENFQALREITRLFLRAPLEFEEELILPGDKVPPLKLSSSGGSRLGWTSWLISKQIEGDTSVVFQTA